MFNIIITDLTHSLPCSDGIIRENRRSRKSRVMFSAGQLFGISFPMTGHYFQFRMRRQVDMIVERGKDLASLRRHRNTKQIFHEQETKTGI